MVCAESCGVYPWGSCIPQVLKDFHPYVQLNWVEKPHGLVCPSSWNSSFFKEKSRCCGGGPWRPLRHTKWIYLSSATCTSQVNAVNLWTCERVIYDGWFWFIICNVSSDWGRAVSYPKECDILLWTEKLSCEVLVKFCLWRHVCG